MDVTYKLSCRSPDDCDKITKKKGMSPIYTSFATRLTGDPNQLEEKHIDNSCLAV
jgi:hypothetical protein